MAREVINGRVFVNGYATDEAGRPRTVSNGYTDEDERDAKEEYQIAKQNPQTENIKNQEPSPKKRKKTNSKAKYTKKSNFQNNFGFKKKYYINGEFWNVEYIDNQYFIGGYATNEIGQPICLETGYDDEAVIQSVNMYKTAKATKYMGR